MLVIVRKLHGRLTILFPEHLVRALRSTEGALLRVSSNADTIILHKKSRGRRSLHSITARLKPSAYRHRNRELNDAPVGKEIW
jgi:antitoxin component of MazEF toxin-antitoxin module